MNAQTIVHEALYEAAIGVGPKSIAAEAELRSRGDHMRANMAKHRRAMSFRSRYGIFTVDPNKVDGLVRLAATSVA